MRPLLTILCVSLTLNVAASAQAQHFWHAHHGFHHFGGHSHSHHQGYWDNGSGCASRGMGWSPWSFGYSVTTVAPMPVAFTGGVVTGFPGTHCHGVVSPLVVMGGISSWPQPAGGFAPVGGFPGTLVTPISMKTT